MAVVPIGEILCFNGGICFPGMWAEVCDDCPNNSRIATDSLRESEPRGFDVPAELSGHMAVVQKGSRVTVRRTGR